ncbi:alginate O-acetyltransferase AlgX-related protein [Xanthobacter sediminis]
MTLLSRHRHYLGALVAGFFGLLLLSNLIPDPLGGWKVRTPMEADWGLLKKVQVALRNAPAFLQDNFGFRATLPVLRRTIRAALDAPDSYPIYAGRDGQLFWGVERTPEQSAGAVVRAEAVARFVTMIGVMQRQLAPLGTKVVVALPPNAQSVELEALPAWTDLLRYPTTEYDMALGGLRAEGVIAVDLRQALRASPPPRYLLTDTHWNARSSVLAFNAVMVAAGHPDWQVDVNDVVGPLEPMGRRGDLLRAMRMPPEVKEEEFRIRLKDRAGDVRFDPALTHHNTHPAFRSIVRDYAPTGARVLILGDSFTAGLWQRLFINADVSVVGWMHAAHTVAGTCDFSFEDVRRFKPDLLIYARTERFFTCTPHAWPSGLPEPDPNAIPAGAAP